MAIYNTVRWDQYSLQLKSAKILFKMHIFCRFVNGKDSIYDFTKVMKIFCRSQNLIKFPCILHTYWPQRYTQSFSHQKYLDFIKNVNLYDKL